MTLQTVTSEVSKGSVCAATTHFAMKCGGYIGIRLGVHMVLSTYGQGGGYIVQLSRTIIQGKSIEEIIPIAKRNGEWIGALVSSFVIPSVYNFLCTSFLVSWKRVGNKFGLWKTKKPTAEPNTRNYMIVSGTIALFVGVLYDLRR